MLATIKLMVKENPMLPMSFVFNGENILNLIKRKIIVIDKKEMTESVKVEIN